jgi:hypothetical protein
MRLAFEDTAKRQVTRDKLERIGDLEATLGVIAILIAGKVAELIAHIGDDGVGGLDLDAR